MVNAGADRMLVPRRVLGPVLTQAVTDERQAGLEALIERRGIEHDECDVFPVIALVLTTNDADGAMEHLASEPQFTIERHIWQSGHEPVRRIEQVAQARAELLAVPVGANAIELLAEKP